MTYIFCNFSLTLHVTYTMVFTSIDIFWKESVIQGKAQTIKETSHTTLSRPSYKRIRQINKFRIFREFLYRSTMTPKQPTTKHQQTKEHLKNFNTSQFTEEDPKQTIKRFIRLLRSMCLCSLKIFRPLFRSWDNQHRRNMQVWTKPE